MTFASTLTDADSSQKYSFGKYTLLHSSGGVEEGGATGLLTLIAPDEESSENCILLRVAYDLTPLSMNLTISEQPGCGVEGKRLHEKMKKNMRASLMRSLENLFENLGR